MPEFVVWMKDCKACRDLVVVKWMIQQQKPVSTLDEIYEWTVKVLPMFYFDQQTGKDVDEELKAIAEIQSLYTLYKSNVK